MGRELEAADGRFAVHHSAFGEMGAVLGPRNITPAGVFFDLGISSPQSNPNPNPNPNPNLTRTRTRTRTPTPTPTLTRTRTLTRYVVKIDPPNGRLISVPRDSHDIVRPEVCFGRRAGALFFTRMCRPQYTRVVVVSVSM